MSDWSVCTTSMVYTGCASCHTICDCVVWIWNAECLRVLCRYASVVQACVCCAGMRVLCRYACGVQVCVFVYVYVGCCCRYAFAEFGSEDACKGARQEVGAVRTGWASAPSLSCMHASQPRSRPPPSSSLGQARRSRPRLRKVRSLIAPTLFILLKALEGDVTKAYDWTECVT